MGAQEERGAAQLPAPDCEVREYHEVLSPNTQPRYDHLHSWSPAVQVVPLQKGLQQEGDRFQCILYRKNDLMLTSDLSLQEERLDDVGETAEAETSHTVEELKQINNQLYKYALKHVLDAS